MNFNLINISSCFFKRLTFSVYFFVAILVLTSLSCGQSIHSDEDIKICQSKFEFADTAGLSTKPVNEIVIEIAKTFIGLEYEAKTIDAEGDEKLIINLTGLDCYTFLEASLSFARCIKLGNTTFGDYQTEIINLRYRNGELKEYPSRLHYFSDWIFDTNKRGITRDITKEIGGVPYENDIDFMSTHPSAYIQLKDNPTFVKKITTIEKNISSRNYYYIPQEQISEVENKIKSGDILGLTTGIKGLDISHTGIAIRMDDNRIHLLHAPTVGKKIQISEEPLADYIAKHKSQTGIMIVRPIEP